MSFMDARNNLQYLLSLLLGMRARVLLLILAFSSIVLKLFLSMIFGFLFPTEIALK